MSRDQRIVSTDISEFWREHDRALAQHANNGEIMLSHDLYRGMPAWFNAYYAHFQRRALRRLLQECHLRPAMRALDLGCGTGRWTGLALEMGLQPYGFDLGQQALRYAAKHWPSAHFTCGELPFLCFAETSFELVISVTVLQHVPHEKQPHAITAIERVLKPGGYLLACETIDVHDLSPHVFSNDRDQWLGMFHQAGLELVKLSSCEYLPQVKVFHWARRLWHQTAGNSHQPVDVTQVAQLLRTYSLLAMLVRLVIALSYPVEYLAATFFPRQWARLACFLLRKP